MGKNEDASSQPDPAEAAARKALHADVGARIRSVRERQDIGQAECARTAGIDTSSLFRIERTGQNLTIETLARLAIALSVPMSELLVDVVPQPKLAKPRTRS